MFDYQKNSHANENLPEKNPKYFGLVKSDQNVPEKDTKQSTLVKAGLVARKRGGQ